MVMAPPPDYAPGIARLAANPNAATGGYGVDAPGRDWNTISKPLSEREFEETFGAVGTVNIAGIIQRTGEPRELQGAEAIYTYERMWKTDGQCAAVFNVYLLPLVQATYSIQAASDDADDVAMAQKTSDNLLHGMKGMTWHRFLWQLYAFRGVYGHYVGEKCWVYDDDEKTYVLQKIAPRLPITLYRWYPNADDELDRIMQRTWIQSDNGVTGTYAFPVTTAQKLLVSTRNQIGNDFLGISLFRPCYKHWVYKDQLYAIDGIAAAKNAIGIPVITETQPNPDIVAQASDRRIGSRSLAAYQANERGYFYMPYGKGFDLKAVSGTVRNIMPSIEHHDLLMARSFLAQFINVDSGGTLIAARDSSSFFLQSLEGEALEVADDVNPVIREMEEFRDRKRKRFSTLQMQDLDQRDMESYLRGVSALITAGGLTNNPETENAYRDDLNLPQLPAAATPAGGGQQTVDGDSQGAQVEDPDDKAARQAAAGTASDIGGEAGAVGELRRLMREFRSRDDARAQRAVDTVELAAQRLRKRRSREGVVTIPQRNGDVLTLRRQGGRWEKYERQPQAWGGVTLPK